MTSKSVTGI